MEVTIVLIMDLVVVRVFAAIEIVRFGITHTPGNSPAVIHHCQDDIFLFLIFCDSTIMWLQTLILRNTFPMY